MTVTLTPIRFAVVVPDSAWKHLDSIGDGHLDLVRENGFWVFRNDQGHAYVLHPGGKATTHLHPGNGEMGNPGAVGRWPTYAAAQEALAHHLAAGADEDCYECKHRLDLGDRLLAAEKELAAEQGFRLAMERVALAIEDSCKARINDAKATLLATAQRERDERQDAYSSALVKLGKTLRRTEDLERELAEAQAEMSRANREREAENLRAFRLEARLFDLGPTPCPHRTERALMGPHGVGCECAESDRWGKPFVVRTMQEIEAENARLRAALSALLVATRRLKLRQGVMEAAEAALREGGAA